MGILERRVNEMAERLQGEPLAALDAIAERARLSRKTLERFRKGASIRVDALVRIEKALAEVQANQ